MIFKHFYGKEQRIARLRTSRGNFIFLAMDHQLTVGCIQELESYSRWIQFCNEEEISGVVLNKGAIREALPPLNCPLILQSMGAPKVQSSLYKCITASIEDALKLDAGCVSIQIDFSSPMFTESLKCCITQIECANEYNMPVLCMVNIPDVKAFGFNDFVNFVIFCAELGVDFIKLPLPYDYKSVDAKKAKQFLKNLPSILLAGGERNTDFKQDLELSKNMGFSGVCVGRNIFMSPNPKETIALISSIY